MAAPAFVSATAHTGNPTTSATVTLPTTAADDILLVVMINAGATGALTPAGTYSGGAWTSIDSGTWTTGWGGVSWSRCTGNHSGQTVVVGTATDSCSATVIRISGAITTGSPIDANISGASVGATNGTLAAFTTTVGNTLVCLCAATDDNQTKSAFTKNAVGMSNLSLATSTGGGDSGVGWAASSQANPGTTGSFAITEPAGTAQGKRLSAFAIIPPPLTTSTAEVSLDSSNDPLSSTDHAMTVRARVTSAVYGTMRLQLYQGGTSKSAEYESSPLTTSFADYSFPLSGSEADSITDYTDLRIRFRGHSSGGDAAVFEVAEMALEIPQAAATPGVIQRAYIVPNTAVIQSSVW